jgi:hypothetical protein
MSRVFHQEDINELYDDEREDIVCPYCENKGYRALLGPKILMPGEPRPEDYDSWLECPRCYQVIPIYEGLKEETVSDTIETTESPFDDKATFETVHKRRTSVTGRKTAPRGIKRRKKGVLHEDSDINQEMRNVGVDNVRIIQDSNP